MNIIGITGTLGAGKGTIVEYLKSHYGFRHYSVRSYLIAEAGRRGLPLDRDTFVFVANDLRARHSASFITDELYCRALADGGNAVIESIRTPGEVLSLRKNVDFILLAIDADPEIRYRRVIERNSETDHVSFDTFIQNERREMTSIDPNHQNIAECMRMADYVLQNNGDFIHLYRRIDDIMQKISSYESC